MGKVMYDKGHRKVVTLTWKYGAGEESVESFKEAFTKLGGSIVKEMYLPFPNVEFQAFITEIGSLKPDAVFVFFAGGGAVKFTKDYAAAGLKEKIPLYGSGFLTDGTLEAQGASAQGLLTTLHYGDGIENAKNKQFRYAYGKAHGVQADVYAVQGYDAALLLAAGLSAVRGSFGDKKALYSAMEKAKIDSPRGVWTMSKAHNPIQDIYLRRVEGNANKVIGVAWKALDDPATGCKMQA
jgi:branched-chain amino acid transport system substrate-binding protein